jgi:hypothetical protein
MHWDSTMNTSAFRIRAAVRMQPADRLPVVKPLNTGWGPVIFFQGKHYPGRVLECKTPIEPGQTGEAIIGVMATQADRLGFQEGSVFELRDGATIVIAIATVLSYSLT